MYLIYIYNEFSMHHDLKVNDKNIIVLRLFATYTYQYFSNINILEFNEMCLISYL